MVEYWRKRIGDEDFHRGDISIERLRDEYSQYPHPSRIKIPHDGYINIEYRKLDDYIIDSLTKQGIKIYWANPYNPGLDTSTTFMLFYMNEQDELIPLLIILPPDEFFDKSRNNRLNNNGSIYAGLTKHQRKMLKLRKKLNLL